MKLKKQMLVAAIVLIFGITAINGFLFSAQGGTSCYCNNTVAQGACDADCLTHGGCESWRLKGQWCYGDDCESTLESTCKDFDVGDEPISGLLVSFGCWDCTDN